jgi:PAS domain S-box-containing protein
LLVVIAIVLHIADIKTTFQPPLLFPILSTMAVDGTGRALTWNPAAERMFGYRAEEAVGSPFFKLLGGAEDIACCQKVSDAGGDSTSATIELRGRAKDGKELPVEITLAAAKVANG